jgi:hypothetical protein
MADDGMPKSAIELAMERLRKKDEEENVTVRPLTDFQKAAIAELRNMYQSKIAELEILQQSQLAAARDPLELEEIGRQFRAERDGLVAERDARIDEIRYGRK